MAQNQEEPAKGSLKCIWRTTRILVVVGLFVTLNTSGFQNFYNAFTWDPLTDYVKERVMKDQAREAQKLYKNNLIKEIEHNIRVLQFNVWCLKENWKNLIDFQNSAKQMFMRFNYDQNVYLKDLSEIDLMYEVQRIYEEFKRAEQQINRIRLGHQPSLSDRERMSYIEQHTKHVNDAIQIHKKLYASLPDRSYPDNGYLKPDWEEHLSELGSNFASIIATTASDEVTKMDSIFK